MRRVLADSPRGSAGRATTWHGGSSVSRQLGKPLAAASPSWPSRSPTVEGDLERGFRVEVKGTRTDRTRVEREGLRWVERMGKNGIDLEGWKVVVVGFTLRKG